MDMIIPKNMESVPESFGMFSYFLQEINIPVWHWGIRIAVCSCFVIAMLAYYRYRRDWRNSKQS